MDEIPCNTIAVNNSLRSFLEDVRAGELPDILTPCNFPPLIATASAYCPESHHQSCGNRDTIHQVARSDGSFTYFTDCHIWVSASQAGTDYIEEGNELKLLSPTQTRHLFEISTDLLEYIDVQQWRTHGEKYALMRGHIREKTSVEMVQEEDEEEEEEMAVPNLGVWIETPSPFLNYRRFSRCLSSPQPPTTFILPPIITNNLQINHFDVFVPPNVPRSTGTYGVPESEDGMDEPEMMDGDGEEEDIMDMDEGSAEADPAQSAGIKGLDAITRYFESLNLEHALKEDDIIPAHSTVVQRKRFFDRLADKAKSMGGRVQTEAGKWTQVGGHLKKKGGNYGKKSISNFKAKVVVKTPRKIREMVQKLSPVAKLLELDLVILFTIIGVLPRTYNVILANLPRRSSVEANEFEDNHLEASGESVEDEQLLV